MRPVMLISPCLDISRKNSTSMDMYAPTEYKPAHTQPNQNHTVLFPLPADDFKPLDKKGVLKIQQIVGSILYYAWAVDMTVLMTLSSITSEQMKATEKTHLWFIQLLDYLASNAEAKVQFHASDMIMNIHSDASYLSKPLAQSWTCGNFSWDLSPRMVSQ